MPGGHHDLRPPGTALQRWHWIAFAQVTIKSLPTNIIKRAGVFLFLRFCSFTLVLQRPN